MTDRFSEAVGGVVIGGEYFTGGLYYCGQKCGNTIYAATEDAVVEKGRERLEDIKNECGAAYSMIYPEKNSWEVRIYQGA